MKKINSGILLEIRNRLGLDVRYLLHGGFWLSVNQAFSSITSFALSVVFVNLLPKETYGTYKYVLSIAGVLSVFTLNGINTAIIRAIARGERDAIRNTTKTRMKWGLISGVSSLAFALYYYLRSDITLSGCFLIAAFFLPFFDSFNTYDSILQGEKKFKQSFKLNLILQTVSGASLALAAFWTKNILVIVLTYFAVLTVLRLISLLITVRDYPKNTQQSTDIVQFGKKLSALYSMGMVGAYFDKILMYNILGPSELAIYSIATSIPERLKGIIKNNISTLALPKYSETQRLYNKWELSKKMALFSLFCLFIFSLYALSANYIFIKIYPSYAKYAQLSIIYGLNILFIPKVIFRVIFESQKASRELFYFQIFSLASKVILDVTLIIVYGLIGAIYATIINEILIYIFLLVRYQKYFKNSSVHRVI